MPRILVHCVAALAVTAPLIEAQAPQRRVGDWIVRGAETVENASIVLAGNLVVESGGSLALNNVALMLECSSEAQCGIHARRGSALAITGGALTAA